MNVDFYRPSSEMLSRYIEGFYFIKNEGSYPLRYYTFPNNFCILTLIDNADLEICGQEVFIRKSDTGNRISSLTFRYNIPLKIHYEEPVKELTIYFRPFGINHFIPDMEDFYTQVSMQSFEPFSGFGALFFRVFEISGRQAQLRYLESELLKLFRPQNDRLTENILYDFEKGFTVGEIAFRHGISRQYLNQYFKLKTGKSPSEFRKILRFRKSLTLMKEKNASLTDISYESLFYDQAHFNRDFKNITRFSPNEFYRKTDLQRENVWLII